MPSPHHGGAPLHANAPTLAKVTLRRAARVHRDARYASAPPPTRLARSLSTAPRTSFPGHSRQPSRREPIRSASCLVPHGPRPSAAPARSLSTAPRASCPQATAPRPSRQEPIHGASCLVSQASAISRPPGAYPQRLVPCAPGHHTLPAYGCDLSLPALDAACLHPNSTIAAGLASRHPNRTLPYRMQPYCTQLTYSRRHHLAPTQSSATYDRRTSL